MTGWKRPEWRAIYIPCRSVERVYGSGNFDDAGDDLSAILNLVCEYPEQYRCRFDFDCSHSNPWYHAMIFEIEGISDSTYEQPVGKVIALGLEDASRSALHLNV
jgi:hypothetical protein